eukprot:scaffold281122_cov23-Tisochrysis_lutea.AAC.1
MTGPAIGCRRGGVSDLSEADGLRPISRGGCRRWACDLGRCPTPGGEAAGFLASPQLWNGTNG